jgi:hypothetical protein
MYATQIINPTFAFDMILVSLCRLARDRGLPVPAAPGGVLAPDELLQINFRGLLQSVYDDDGDDYHDD